MNVLGGNQSHIALYEFSKMRSHRKFTNIIIHWILVFNPVSMHTHYILEIRILFCKRKID